MKCHYENDEEGKDVVGAKCYECTGYLHCERFQKIEAEGKAWWK